MNVSVIIPYRSSSSDRDRIFDAISYRWKSSFPGWEVVIGRNDDDVFSRSKARNDGADRASGDMLIFADADTYCNREYVLKAVELARSYPWSFPYRVYYNLSQLASKSLLSQLRVDSQYELLRPGVDSCEFIIPSVGGILCIKRENFEQIGGYDEKFVGWGYEDDAFRIAADTILGMHVCVPGGWVAHLWHEAAEETRFAQPSINRNLKRFRKYEEVSGRPERMAKLIGKSDDHI